jgi:flavin reductase (DIM6/NTAB) family NADH-FMN oxidoreductase RutF
LIHQVEIGLHTQFIGEILDIKAEEDVLDEKGMLDIEKVRPFFFDPEAGTYHRIGEFLGAAFSIGQDLRKKV